MGADTSSEPDDQAVGTSGGSDSETAARPTVTAVMSTAPVLHMPLGTRDDMTTAASDAWPTMPCDWPDQAPQPGTTHSRGVLRADDASNLNNDNTLHSTVQTPHLQ